MRHEWWLLRACHAAVATLLLYSTLPGIHEEMLSRGCELLYHMGQYIPEANDLVLGLWNEAHSREIRWPEVGKRFLRASLVNVRRSIVVNAAPLTLSDSGIGVSMPNPGQVTFAQKITSVEGPSFVLDNLKRMEHEHMVLVKEQLQVLSDPPGCLSH